MQLSITGRKLEVTPALKDYIQKKIEKIRYFFDHIIDVKVTLDVEKIYHVVDVSIHSDGKTFNLNSKTEDMYESIDKVFDKVERQVRKVKEKYTNRKGNIPIAEVFNNVDLEDDDQLKISNVEEITPKPMTEHEALLQLGLNKSDFLIFNNGKNNFKKSIALKNTSKDDYSIISRYNDEWIERIVKLNNDDIEIVNENKFNISIMSSDEAIKNLMNEKNNKFYIYNDENKNSLDIVYRMQDNKLGLVTSE